MRAFTIVELIVALVIGAILTTAAMAVLIVAKSSASEAAARAAMQRDGQLAMDSLERDLSFLGAGVPKDTNSDTAGASVGKSLFPVVRRASVMNFVFEGDLPYPNAEVPGIAGLARVNLGLPGRTLAVTDEISGPCVPPAVNGSGPCVTSDATLVPGTYGGADNCDATQKTARTCPWGMHKWQNGAGGDTFLAFVAIDGHWFNRKVNGIDTGGPVVAFEGKYTGVSLVAGFPGAGADTINPAAFVGAGYAANIDRVFYALEDPGAPGAACASTNCTLFRRQCWGDLGDPANANFPVDGTAFFGTTATPTACTAGTDGTGWEVLATGISAFSLTYFKDTTALSAPLNAADRSSVRAVELDVTFTRKIPGQARTATINMKRRFFLNNREAG